MCIDGKPRESHCECPEGYASNKLKIAEYATSTDAPQNTTNVKLFCEPINLCATDAHECSVNAQCRPKSPGKAACLCNAGFRGDGKVCKKIDSCRKDNGGCDRATSTCVSSGPGSNVCECNPGHFKAPSGQCFPISACSAEKSPCHRRAQCVDTAPGEAKCTCSKGYTGDGKFFCDIVMPCNFHVKSTMLCGDHQNCMLNPKTERSAGASAHCECAPGYLAAGEKSCAPVRRCSQENATGCHENATCTDWGPGRRSCKCNEGFHGTGFDCQAFDACDINNGGCSPLSKCTSIAPGVRKCKCPSGYSTLDAGESCIAQNLCKKCMVVATSMPCVTVPHRIPAPVFATLGTPVTV